MPAGRPRKPTSKHHNEGTYRKDRHGDRGATAKKGIRKPPRLPKHASWLWDRVIDQLKTWGAGHAHGPIIADMCRWYHAYRVLLEAGDVEMAAKAWGKFWPIACRFGLSLSDMTNMNATEEAKDDQEARHFGVVG